MSENILPEVREWCDQRVAEAVAAEREACAKVAAKIRQYCQNVADSSNIQMLYPQTAAGNQYAATKLSEVIAAIHARGKEADDER